MKQSTILLIGGAGVAALGLLYYTSTHGAIPKADELPPGAKVDTTSGIVTFDANRTWNSKTHEITGIGPNRTKSVIGKASTLKEAMQTLGIVTPATTGSPVKGAQQTPAKVVAPAGQQPAPAAPRLPRQGPQLPAPVVQQQPINLGNGFAYDPVSKWVYTINEGTGIGQANSVDEANQQSQAWYANNRVVAPTGHVYTGERDNRDGTYSYLFADGTEERYYYADNSPVVYQDPGGGTTVASNWPAFVDLIGFGAPGYGWHSGSGLIQVIGGDYVELNSAPDPYNAVAALVSVGLA